jgi:hypothetical protein
MYTIIEVLKEYGKVKGNAMVIKEEITELEYFPEDSNG